MYVVLERHVVHAVHVMHVVHAVHVVQMVHVMHVMHVVHMVTLESVFAKQTLEETGKSGTPAVEHRASHESM